MPAARPVSPPRGSTAPPPRSATQRAAVAVSVAGAASQARTPGVRAPVGLPGLPRRSKRDGYSPPPGAKGRTTKALPVVTRQRKSGRPAVAAVSPGAPARSPAAVSRRGSVRVADGHRRGLSRRNTAQSRAQARLLFAKLGPAARSFVASYAALPERKRSR